MSDRLARFLAEEDREWRALHDVLARVPAEGLAEPRIPPDMWAAKDVVFHVGAWLADAANVLERIRLGTFDGEELDSEVQNRLWFAISRDLDVATCRAEMEASRVRCLAELGALAEITPQAQEWFEEAGALHYRTHAKDLLDWVVPGAGARA